MAIDWTYYIDNIHSPVRRTMHSDKFGFETKLVLLDFLGCETLFINEYGAIWDRTKIVCNKSGFVEKGCLPLVYIDMECKYPWVRLPMARSKTWIPINLLLGWAYQPNANKEQKHFVFKDSMFMSGIHTSDDGSWSDKADTTSDIYNTFIKRLYS